MCQGRVVYAPVTQPGYQSPNLYASIYDPRKVISYDQSFIEHISLRFDCFTPVLALENNVICNTVVKDISPWILIRFEQILEFLAKLNSSIRNT